jgi:putative transposase
LADRYRELTDSRDDLLPHGRSRRMTAAVRTVGDSGFGFWAGSRDTSTATRERRCLWHNQANVGAALPKSASHGGGPRPGRSTASKTSTRPRSPSRRSSSIMAPFIAKIAKIAKDNPALIECYRCPAAPCIHLPTSNPVESTLATVHPRTEVTKGPGLWAAGIAIVYRPIGAVQTRGRAINAAHLVAPGRVGEIFRTGKLLEPLVGGTPAAPIESARNGGRPKQPQPQVLTNYPAMPRQLPLAVPTHLQLATAAVPTAAGRMVQVPAAI